MEGRFDKQDETLQKIESKLDEHIENTGQFRLQMTPLVESFETKLAPMAEAFDTMKSGIKVMGKIGDAASWIGKKVAAISITVAAVLGAFAAWKNWFGH